MECGSKYTFEIGHTEVDTVCDKPVGHHPPDTHSQRIASNMVLTWRSDDGKTE